MFIYSNKLAWIEERVNCRECGETNFLPPSIGLVIPNRLQPSLISDFNVKICIYKRVEIHQVQVVIECLNQSGLLMLLVLEEDLESFLICILEMLTHSLVEGVILNNLGVDFEESAVSSVPHDAVGPDQLLHHPIWPLLLQDVIGILCEASLTCTLHLLDPNVNGCTINLLLDQDVEESVRQLLRVSPNKCLFHLPGYVRGCAL